MGKAIHAAVDPYVLLLLGTVVIASLLPCGGTTAVAFHMLATAAITLLFFLHGAKLARSAIVAGFLHWRLHAVVLAVTFVLFPLLGLAFSRVPGLAPPVAAGLLFLTLLPSTVQSSIAFTSIAGGNVSAAVCSASFSNLAGIVVTPILVATLMGAAARSSGAFASAEGIALQLLLPFVLGHLLRPLIGGFVSRHKTLVTTVDRGSILLVVYTAFSAAVVEGFWRSTSIADLLVIIALCSAILAIVLVATDLVGALFGFALEDRIVLRFCGSKKSLASGVPMAGVLFPAALVGPIILPLMIFHQIQLIVCAILARRYADRSAAVACLPE
ncbi:MAG: bile acid:sodium symporter [Sphingomonadaceae bacterium]|nr:bile acid:sodium symporter [Sphingomonadaceae bacterium]